MNGGGAKSIGFGAILWDDIPDPEAKESCPGARNIGGSVFNVLFHLRKFGQQAFMISGIGNDELGGRTLATIEQMGIRRDFITIVPEETCLIKVTFNRDGYPQYSSPDIVSWDNITLSPGQYASLAGQEFDYLVHGTLEQRDARSRHTLREVVRRGRFRNIFVDLTLRKQYSRELLEETMNRASILKMNEEEAMEVGRLFGFKETRIDRFIRTLAREFAAGTICITCGAKGAWAGDASSAIHCPAYLTKVCDTVGCGDAFSAAFIHKHQLGATLETCCDYGNKFAALIASKRSSCPSYDLKELDSYVKKIE